MIHIQDIDGLGINKNPIPAWPWRNRIGRFSCECTGETGKFTNLNTL